MERLLGLSDIALVPAQLNAGRLEGKYNYSVKDMADGTMSLPVFTAPMDAIVNETNWQVWADNGIRPILPRTSDIKIRLEGCEYIFAAFGLKEIQEYFLAFKRNSSRQFRVCIDTGNGHDIELLNAAINLRKIYGNQVIIMAGNIGNPKVYIDYCSKGIDFVRVGMTTGSLVDRSKYGFEYPMASMLLDIKGLRNTSCVGLKHTKVIADGGLYDPTDILKALALGADYCICGRQFAKLVEAAGPIYQRVKDGSGEHHEPVNASEVIKMPKTEMIERKLKRLYAGNTTYDIQARRDGYEDAHDWGGKKKACDASSKWVDVDENLASWLSRAYDIFAYGFTMAGATTWDEFRTKINICRIQ